MTNNIEKHQDTDAKHKHKLTNNTTPAMSTTDNIKQINQHQQHKRTNNTRTVANSGNYSNQQQTK